MNQDLLLELRRRGIRLRLTDGHLDVVAPAGALTAELREALTRHRDELIADLGRHTDDEALPQITPQPAARNQPFPLTDIQHAYWVGRSPAVELGGVSTHLYLELEGGGLDLDRLADSLRKVIDRHDMLRAVIDPDGRQRILPEVPPYEIAAQDLRGMTEEQRASAIEGTRAELAAQVIPADQWPLFEIRASQLAGDRLRVHFSLDFLIVDAWSVNLLFADWRRFYEEPDWSPKPLTLSYRDCVLAEEERRSSTRYKKAEQYWTERLEALPPAPALPLALQPAQLERPDFTRRTGVVEKGRWERLKERARQHGVTPSSVLMSAFSDVLGVWSRQPHFTLNLTLFDRAPVHGEIDQVVGDFTTLNLLAVQPSPTSSFAERTQQLTRQLMEDLEHLEFSGIRALRERARRVGSGPAAAMPIVFTSALGVGREGSLAGARDFIGDIVHGISQTPQVWLDHQVMEDHGDLVFHWDAVEALFPDRMLDDMFAVYRGLLDRLIDDEAYWGDDRAGVELPDWQRAERRAANATGQDIPERTLCGLVLAQAGRTPDAVAVVDGAGEHSYRDVTGRAAQLARCLAEDGRPLRNTLTAVVLDKGWEQVAAVLGVNLAGAAYLPIDPQWPAARRDDLLDQGRVHTVVTSARLRSELTWPAGTRLVTLDDPQVTAAATEPPGSGPAPEDLAYVIFTSGSTGRPKGVMIDHRGAANTVQDINDRFGIGPQDSVLGLSALSFDLSVYDVFGPLAAGGRIVLPTPGRQRDPAHWSELMAAHRVTVWNSVPALMQAWLDATDGSAQAGGEQLRLALLSGDWIPVTLPDALRARCPKTAVISLGGATEASIWSVHYPIAEVPPHWSRIPYGKPLANQTMQVLDAALRPCPVWSTGEIHIGGKGVALGYWADPDKTAERFVTHPVTGERLYRTGDLGRYLPGGDIEFLGREDHQVKINGYRIELGEITAALERQAGIGQALVTVADGPHGGRKQLVAYTVPDGEAAGETGNEEGATEGWQRLVAAGERECRTAGAELAEELGAFTHVWQVLEDLCPDVMERTLARLDTFTSPGEEASAETIVAAHGIKDRYVGLVRQWLALLAGAGRLKAAGEGRYQCVAPLDAEAADERVRSGLAAIQGGDAYRVFVDYVAHCADRQVELLLGRSNPLELLLPGGSSEVTDMLYARNPVSALQNRVAGQVARQFTDGSTAEPVRFLEVGAGTGATTAAVLPQLPADGVRYRFTDISTYFVRRAERRFTAYPFVDYGVCDLDDAGPHTLAPGSADCIIAANVLHDAKDLHRTLEGLRDALAPGGLLLLVEGTENSPIQMITVGFIEGFAHQGRELPLLGVQEWRTALRSAGFEGFAALPADGPVTGAMAQHVLLARATGRRAGPDPAQLRSRIEAVLPEYMVPHHYVTLDRLPLTPNGKVDLHALPLPWEGEGARERTMPRTPTEETVHGIWCEALERDDFGVDDDFFDLGGDSLHAIRILERLRQEFGLQDDAEQGLARLFGAPTIAELAEALDDEKGA
ncbi:amino acid adenylation domain-containing protein [Streptomyces sp. NPDC057743]|uniref:non-ribosomal peptide synthetase n=1 Tax=Streptomyces sp. NPDC057743 TaxID=3346236 RepID=UPI0036BD25B2